MYVLWTGCAWRMLPHDLPAWSTVYYYYSRWTATTLNLVRSILGR
ncbi:MAG: transposase [Caldilineaceae bacterium]